MDLIQKIQAAGLTGRGGAGYPTASKWSAVLKAKKDNKIDSACVICNASEGELNIEKDKYLIQFHPAEVANGIRLACDTVGADRAIVLCQDKDLKKIRQRLAPCFRKIKVEFIGESGGYLCGEETTLLETIEGKRSEPRLKPPFPTEHGLFGMPTIVNNVETFYFVSKISKGEYANTRFVSVRGEARNPGVFEVPAEATIEHILKLTKNVPHFNYFLQVGGGAAGSIILQDETDAPLKGAGSIVIYDRSKIKPRLLMKRWIEFFHASNCGKCAPCREGLYRLREELNAKKPNWLMMRAILETMRDSSFCPLGKSVHEPMMGYLEKLGTPE